jgi:tripartite-type tricarboxylate transporter receptor subunit TctC
VKFPRRRFLYLTAGAAALPAVTRIARAQAYPARPVRLLVGFPPGGSADIFARLIAQWLSERFGQSFIIENRPGAGTNIAAEAIVRAPPDGYMLFLVGSVNAINATLYDKLNFDFIRDIASVAGTVRIAGVFVVNPSVPASTVPEFIAYAKANPGKVNMASSGNGTSGHVAGELFKMMTGVNMLHVPYRGEAPALSDLMAAQVQVMFATVPGAIQYIRAGTLRALAVTTSTRSKLLPDIPSVGEFLPGYEASTWNGIGAPRNTPADTIDKLNKAVNACLEDPKMLARFAELGGDPMPMTPDEFAKLVADETDKWCKVVRFSGAKAN